MSYFEQLVYLIQLLVRVTGLLQRCDRDEVVGIKDLEAFEEEAKPPGNGNQPAGDGRREGDAMKFVLAMGEQALDLCRTNAMCLFIDRVEPEVVGEKHAAGLSRRGVGTSEHTEHVAANRTAKFRIKDR